MTRRPLSTIPRPLLYAALYFTEGAPIGFLWWTLPSVLRTQGVEVSSIGLLVALLGVPWAFKFLWAPIVDLSRSDRWGYRDWIVACQVCMALFLLPLVVGKSAFAFPFVVAFLVAHAVAAATQDVAIDGLCIVQAPAKIRGLLNGWMQAGMLLGRSIFGGGTLILLELLSFEYAAGLLVGLLLVSAFLVRWLVAREPVPQRSEDRALSLQGILRVWKSLFTDRRILWALAFAATAGASYEAVGTLAGPFLIDSGTASRDVGWFLGTVSVVLMTLGALAGGWWADRVPRIKAAGSALVFVAASAIALGAASWAGNSAATWLFLCTVYTGIGVFTASTYAYFMDLTRTEFAATQFSALMGATNLCEVWSTGAGGFLVEAGGYGSAFIVLAGLSLGALALLRQGRPLPGLQS